MGWKEEKGVPGVVLKQGTTQKKPVTDERDGSVGGHITEHWDGSQDVDVIAKTHRVTGRPQEGG